MLPAEASLHLIPVSFWVPDSLEPLLEGMFPKKGYRNYMNTQPILAQAIKAVPLLLYGPWMSC